MEHLLGKRFPAPVGEQQRIKVKLQPRNYQMELAEPGLRGQNYICVAPTGSGKTLVAAMVIADHLQKKRHEKNCHVLFVVSTKPLADQQKEKIKAYIENIRVGVYFGDCPSRVADSLTENDVSVCTAGKLLNELQQELVKFSQFSLVIFDECHHTIKSHPYAEIMKMYLHLRIKEWWLSLQIIGMTASPGAGNNSSLNESNTIDHMVRLMAFLDAIGGIKIVRKNLKELQEHTRSSFSTYKITQSRDLTTDRFIAEVVRVMTKIEADFDLENIKYCGFQKWSQEYETKIQQKIVGLKPRESSYSTICGLQHLRVYSIALNIYIELRETDAIEIIEQSKNIEYHSRFSSKELCLKHSKERLVECLKKIPHTENPMLKGLKQVLFDNFQGGNFRAILFVRTKKHTVAIQQWIHEDCVLGRLGIIPVIVTGQGDGGMTQAMQKDVMRRFREGRANLLIATSVAEEGLDVPECNIVIRYQYASNEIAKEQTEGRARARNSSGYAFSSSSKITCQEKKNEELVKLVKRVLDGDFLPSGRELLKKIEQIQWEILLDFQPEEKAAKVEADIQEFRLTYKPRKYQIELAEPGMRGQNYICVAPTGSGKTLVAAMVISDHLRKNSHKKNCHVLFIVSTRPLADQQKEKIKDYIENLSVGVYVGDKAKSSRLADSLRVNKVSVCTAGKLRNELYEGKVKFSQFSLVIFDECHHTIKSHPYAEIMRLYLLIRKKEPLLSLQIIGMTASPGAGGSNSSLNKSKAINHMVRLMAFLDAKGGIKIIRENLQELRQHTRSNFSTYKITQSRDPTTDLFVDNVVSVMGQIEACFDLNDIKLCGFQKWSQEYATRVQQKFVGLQSVGSVCASTSGLQYLYVYSTALNFYMELRNCDAIETIEHTKIIKYSDQFCPKELWLKQSKERLVECLKEVPCDENPMLIGLKKVLVLNYQDGCSRLILFVRTKKHTQAIKQWIYEDDDFTRLSVIPVIITGQGDGGMTQAMQKSVLKSFREGRANLLIATSVAEEGLDVPECNVVIRYQYASNEIAKEQTEGRARARNSSGYTICDSSKMTSQEIKNEELVKLVKRILEENCLPTGRELRQKIEAIQEELSQEYF